MTCSLPSSLNLSCPQPQLAVLDPLQRGGAGGGGQSDQGQDGLPQPAEECLEHRAEAELLDCPERGPLEHPQHHHKQATNKKMFKARYDEEMMERENKIT